MKYISLEIKDHQVVYHIDSREVVELLVEAEDFLIIPLISNPDNLDRAVAWMALKGIELPQICDILRDIAADLRKEIE